MTQNELILRLNNIYTQIKKNDTACAVEAFQSMSIVDTEFHLNLNYELRHLIWDLYEYLIAQNVAYIDRNQILAELTKILSKPVS